MIQLNLFGNTPQEIKDEEERVKKVEFDKQRAIQKMEFLNEELEHLKIIKVVVDIGEGKFEIDEGCDCIIEFKGGNPIFLDLVGNKDEDWENNWLKKKFLGEWWYCNEIQGWNNNVPCENRDKFCSYDEVPINSCMRDIRDCFISVEREGTDWDRTYCLERLNMAISCYEKEIRGESSIIEVEEEEKEEEVKPLTLLQLQGGTNK